MEAMHDVCGLEKAMYLIDVRLPKVAKIGEVGYAVLTGWAMHISILAEEDAVKVLATRAAMLK